LVASLVIPFAVRQNAWWEWQTAYWLLERQTAHVAAHGTPTLFLHTGAATFYPFFLFYGGPLFSLLAYPGAVLGAWPVFVGATAAAMVAGYLGIWWTACNLGLSRAVATLPALSYATAPYMIALLYGRGAWTELVAANAAAVALGAATAVLTRPARGGRGAFVALAVATAAVAGTHNVTLMMSGVVLTLAVLALVPVVARKGVWGEVARRLSRIAGAVALGLGLVAAWLIPNLWLGPKTRIAESAINLDLLHDNAFMLTPSNVLSPWPRVPESDVWAPWLFDQPAVLAMAFALVAVAVTIAVRRHDHWAAVLVSSGALIVLGTALTLLVVHPGWWDHFPRIVQTVQIPFRLVPYIGLVAALIIALTVAGMRPRRLRQGAIAVLAVATVVQVGFGLHISLDSQAASNASGALLRHDEISPRGEPDSFSGELVFTQVQFRILNHATARPTAPGTIPVSLTDPTTSDVGTATAPGARGDRRALAVVWSPFIRSDGDARIVGRDADGLAVVRVDRTDRRGEWTAHIRSRPVLSSRPWQALLAQLVTVVSLGLLLPFWLWPWIRGRGTHEPGRRRRQPGQASR
jgi:hypothetical protein